MVVDILEKRQKIITEKGITDSKLAIDLIIEHSEKFSDIEIRDHIETLASGYETLAICLSHTILLLAMHPEVEEKLYDELINLNINDVEVIDQTLMKKCEYLDMVFNESCRLLPAVPIILRETLREFEFDKNVIIPEGFCMIVNIFALHRNKNFWGEDADQFKPERFTKENSEKRQPNIFFPFSAGQRICIAYKYSEIAIKIIIARLVLKYKFKTTLKLENLELKSFISLKLCGPHNVSIEERRE